MHQDPPHIPVLLDDVLAALAPVKGGRYLDGTFGAGGYTRAILDAAEGVEVLAIDRDPDAMAAGAAMVDAYAGRLRLWAGPFGDLDHCAQSHDFVPLDGIVLSVAVAAGDEARKLAMAQFRTVVRTGSHLFTFVTYYKALGGHWGRSVRHAGCGRPGCPIVCA